jgi:hypothetical protein
MVFLTTFQQEFEFKTSMVQQQNLYLKYTRANGKGPVVKERYRHYYSMAICSKPF